MSRIISTSDTFIKPWCAFAQVSLCGTAWLVADCLQESKTWLQVKQVTTRITHRVLFDVGYHFSADGEITTKYTSFFRSMVCMLNFPPLFPLSLVPQNLWLKDQRPPRHLIYSGAVLQRVGSISSNYSWEDIYRSNKWMDLGAILFRKVQLLRRSPALISAFRASEMAICNINMFLLFF